MFHQGFAPGEEQAAAYQWDADRIPVRGARIAKWFGAAVSFALLVAIVVEFRSSSVVELSAIWPRSFAFWGVFALYYLSGPFGEWIIYRRLWKIPSSGIAALLRKQVSNELLLGYLGETQFYAWARSRTHMTAAPFGAIKDVAILSALTGNIATLAMLGIAWPLVSANMLGAGTKTMFLSLSVVAATSFVILLFRSRLFTLPRRDLWFIAGIHMTRIVAIIGLAALMWHLVLPGQPLVLWLVLSTLRMLVSRLPLVPNKDVVFAGFAAFLLGNDVAVSGLMTMMAGIVLVTHLIVGAVLSSAHLATSRSNA